VPSRTPSPALAALVTRSYPIEADVWADFWQRLAAKELHPGEAVAVLSSLTTQMPDGASVSALLSSLRAGNPQPAAPARTTVNIVGTGGGPSTFNLSSASAFVAAAMGTRVIKTGSRAYASRTGSVDLLDRLGIRMARSYEELEQLLDTFGIACAGPFVYPKELRLLARQILPFDMKTVGRFFNLVGPFLLVRSFLGEMKKKRSGHIVTIGSVADRTIYTGNAAYSAAKFGVRAIHEVLRAELRGTGVRATLISPAAVVVAFGFSALVGLFFGIWPARRAAPTARRATRRRTWIFCW